MEIHLIGKIYILISENFDFLLIKFSFNFQVMFNDSLVLIDNSKQFALKLFYKN